MDSFEKELQEMQKAVEEHRKIVKKAGNQKIGARARLELAMKATTVEQVIEVFKLSKYVMTDTNLEVLELGISLAKSFEDWVVLSEVLAPLGPYGCKDPKQMQTIVMDGLLCWAKTFEQWFLVFRILTDKYNWYWNKECDLAFGKTRDLALTREQKTALVMATKANTKKYSHEVEELLCEVIETIDSINDLSWIARVEGAKMRVLALRSGALDELVKKGVI